MVVLLVLFPTVMVLSKVLSPFLHGLPFPLQMFLSNVSSVILMTWLFMPLALRGLGFWLTPAGTGVGGSSPRTPRDRPAGAPRGARLSRSS